jgi:uncharacterized protein
VKAAEGLSGFDRQKYLNLETFRKNGRGVRTPVWFAAAPGEPPTLYVYTPAHSGKAKRIRNSSVSKIAPCDARGAVTGPWIEAHAKIVSGDEFAVGMALINRKYRPLKYVFDLLVWLSKRHERVMIAIRPV